MKNDKEKLGRLILGMRAAYARGENAMAWARANSESNNSIVSTLIAYDLQAGTYVEEALRNPKFTNSWCEQLAGILSQYIDAGDRILEVGVGEATTLAGVMKRIDAPSVSAYGFDLSWSRLRIAEDWTKKSEVTAKLFVGDLFNIPLADNTVDVVYTSHSLEPNGGKEEKAIKELLRVARKAVVLVEPYYELASNEAQKRMLEHGYVRGLKQTSEKFEVDIVADRLLEVCNNPLNPSGVIVLIKKELSEKRDVVIKWQCPLTGALLTDRGEYYFSDQVGIAYPVLNGIPCLRAEHAIVSSKLASS